MWNGFLPVSFMSEILSSLRSSYTRVPATSLSSFRRWESGAVAIWLICKTSKQCLSWNVLLFNEVLTFLSINKWDIIHFGYRRDEQTNKWKWMITLKICAYYKSFDSLTYINRNMAWITVIVISCMHQSCLNWNQHLADVCFCTHMQARPDIYNYMA